MTSDPATPATTSSGSSSFAVVTYLPDPLGSFLTDLRRMLPADNGAEAHVTILPPRVLAVSACDVEQEVRKRLSSARPFEIVFGDVLLFRETKMLYLDIHAGHDEVLRLHDLLNEGSLHADESFDFVPHLTLAGPLASNEIEHIWRKTRSVWQQSTIERSFVAEELVLLYQPDKGSNPSFHGANCWSRLALFPLLEAVSAAPHA